MQSGFCTMARQREKEKLKIRKWKWKHSDLLCSKRILYFALIIFTTSSTLSSFSGINVISFSCSLFSERESGPVFRFDGGSDDSIGQSIGLAWFSAGINVVGIAKGWRGLIVWHLLSSPGSQERYC